MNCQDCLWSTEGNVWFSATKLKSRVFQMSLPSPEGSVLKFAACGSVQCNGNSVSSCIIVPGIKPTNAGTVQHMLGSHFTCISKTIALQQKLSMGKTYRCNIFN